MDIEIEFQNLDHLIARLSDTSKLVNQMKDAANFVEGVAREKAPKGTTSKLIGSIENKVEVTPSQITATVFTPVDYAPFVEWGTGVFATNGNGRKGGWGIPIGNEFTEAQAEKYNYPIIERGGKKYAWTYGSHPHPFLGPAIRENKDVILEFLKEGLIND